MVTSTHTSASAVSRRLRGGLCALALVVAAAALLVALPATASAGVDDWVHIWEVVRLVDYQQSRPTPPGGVFVYMLGDSIARESTINDASWTRALRRKATAAGKVRVFTARDVAGHNQTFGMDEKIVEGLPRTPQRQPNGIVLIGVGISRFIGPPTPMAPASLQLGISRFIGPPTPMAPASLQPPAPGLEPPLSPWAQHHYDGRAPLSLTRKRELVPRWMDRRWAGFQENKARNVAKIQRIIDLCKSKGLRPIILDLPLDLRVVGSGLDKPRNAIRAAMNGLARRNDIRYIHFNESLGLPSSSFWDLHHLLKPGYERWQARLSAEVVKGLPAAQ
jgi:hypothetical protein